MFSLIAKIPATRLCPHRLLRCRTNCRDKAYKETIVLAVFHSTATKSTPQEIKLRVGMLALTSSIFAVDNLSFSQDAIPNHTSYYVVAVLQVVAAPALPLCSMLTHRLHSDTTGPLEHYFSSRHQTHNPKFRS